MYVIVVEDSLAEHRNKQLNELLDIQVIQNNRFVSYIKFDNKQQIAYSIVYANVWKSENGAQQIIDKCEKEKARNTSNRWYGSALNNILDYHLSILKINEAEYNNIINTKIDKIRDKYEKDIQILEEERRKFK